MSFAAVGSIIQQQNSSTFSLTPGGIGDLITLEIVQRDNGTTTVSSVSSSNVTWSALSTSQAGSSNTGVAVVYQGKVTATSTQTVTVAWSAATPSNIRIAGQEFSSTTGSWALDTQGTLDSTGTNTWPSLTPAGSGELYFGWAVDGVNAVAGSTSGYTYDIDSFGNGMGFNPACTGAAQAPVWGDSTQLFGVMVLVKETGAAAVSGTVQPRATVPVPRRRAGPALSRGSKPFTGFVAVAAPRQQPQTLPRRTAARAYVRFTPVVTTNAAAAGGPAGSVPVLMVQRTEVIARTTGRVVRR